MRCVRFALVAAVVLIVLSAAAASPEKPRQSSGTKQAATGKDASDSDTNSNKQKPSKKQESPLTAPPREDKKQKKEEELPAAPPVAVEIPQQRPATAADKQQPAQKKLSSADANPVSDWRAVIQSFAQEQVALGNAKLRQAWQSLSAPMQVVVASTTKGFASSAAFGTGVSSLDVAAPTALITAAGNVASLNLSDLEALFTTLEVFVRQHALTFFYYSVGTIVADLLGLAVLQQLVASSSSAYRWKSGGALCSFWSSHNGFVLLIATAAVPHGFMDLVVPLAVLLRLPLEAAVGAITIGKLLRPYVVALLLAASGTECFKSNAVTSLLMDKFAVVFGSRGANGAASSAEAAGLTLSVFWGFATAAVVLLAISKLFGRGVDEAEELLAEDD